MAIDRLVSMVLRAGELVFAAIVAGVNGDYLHHTSGTAWQLGRFIYTEVIAALSILFAIIWLFPFSGSFIHWPMDVVISLCWFASFGLLVNLIGNDCGYIFDWGNVAPRGDVCGKFKADIAFAFLSAILWLVSALIGVFWVRKHERVAARADAAHANRRRWYRRSRV